MDVNDMEYRMGSELPMMQTNSPPQARQGCPYFNAEPLPSFSHPHNNPNGRQHFSHYYHSFNPGPPNYYESYHSLVRSHPPLQTPTPTPPVPRRGPIASESYVYRTWYHQQYGTMPPTTPPAPAPATGASTGSGASSGDDGGRVAAGSAGPAARYAGGEGPVSGPGASGAAPAAAPGADSTRPEGADGTSTSTNPAHAGPGGFQSMLAQPGVPTQASAGGSGANGHHQMAFERFAASSEFGPYHSPYNMPRPSASAMYTGGYSQLQNPPHPQGLASSSSAGTVDRPQLQLLSSRGPSLPALNPPFHTHSHSHSHSHNSHSLTQTSAPPMATDSTPSAEPNAASDALDYRRAPGVEHRRWGLGGRPHPTAPSGAEGSHLARARARALYHHSDYDGDEDMRDIGDMLADEDEVMLMAAASAADAGGARAARSEEDRVRDHQLLRGQMTTRRVASRTAISQLQTIDIASLEESEKTCVICYNEFGIPNPEGVQEAPLRLPKCQHIFGENCIKKWFEESDSCPYCRGKVPSEMITVTTPAAREYLERQYGRLVPQIFRQGASPPTLPPSHGDVPPRRQSGDRRSPPSETEMRRRLRQRHHNGRLSMSLATPHAPPSVPAGPQQTAPWATPYARQSLSPTRSSQRSQYGPNTTNNPYYAGMPPIHLPTGMGSAPGPSLQAGAAGYGYHGQPNSGDDARYQGNPSGGAALATSGATHLPYPPQITPVGPVEGGQPALGDSRP